MSLLARIDAALLRRHVRACPWPTGHGAVTTVQPERPAMSEFARTCGIGQPGHVCGLRAIGVVAVQPYRDVFSEAPLAPGIVYLCKHHYYDPILESDVASNPPSSDSQPLAADSGTELRSCDSNAAQSESIPNTKFNPTVLYLTAEIAKREDALGVYDDEVTRLHALLDAQDAKIERMAYERSHPFGEATNVPDDPTTSQLPVAPRLVVGHGAVGNTPMCLVHPDHFMPCSRCLGYGCPACASQAADDRRSL